MDTFTQEEETMIFEAARVAFEDAEIFDHLAFRLDISDECLSALRDKLQNFMDKK